MKSLCLLFALLLLPVQTTAEKPAEDTGLNSQAEDAKQTQVKVNSDGPQKFFLPSHTFGRTRGLTACSCFCQHRCGYAESRWGSCGSKLLCCRCR
ncbi:neutrophil antibiotic peptide NP-1-like [Vombatus ursinus]|uniref:neutrophil antibiotic peptide NP-1-like n=1 Tax=Vombatus ursinus TaxID=29139 RepID=UPI000FFCEC55|nr:neutrophil antibiotic peptide NP-1-like [Vombatus ursinus]